MFPREGVPEMKRFRVICLVLALVLLIGMLTVGCKKREQKSAYLSAVENYYAAIQKNDFSKLQAAMPPQALDALGMNAADLSGKAASYSDTYGAEFTISVKELGSRQLDEAQCKDLSSYLRGDYGISEKIANAYLAEFEITVSGTKNTQTRSEGYVVYQLGDQWYMDLWADGNVESIRAIYDAE